MSKPIRLCLQMLLIAAAIVAAMFLFDRGKSDEAASAHDTSHFDMLGYLDERIASQECVKDVRCWSSVSKLQMFAAGAPIEHEALGMRIEQYNNLFDSIWRESSVGSDDAISSERLVAVLTRRFPHEQDSESGKIEFVFSQEESPVMVMQDLVDDYSDTIEAWRLLQSWASRKVDDSGKLSLSPVFSEEALNEFQKFLVAFDIALLRHASVIAAQRKSSVVDARSMELAFHPEDSQP